MLAALGVALGTGLATAPAAAYYPVPVNQTPPTITGAPVVGNTLTVSTGGWVGQPPLFYNFSWTSPQNSNLSTSATYVVKKSDIGQVLTARVTVQDGNNNSAYADVSTVAVTASDVVNTVAAKLTGGFVVGEKATLKPGRFTSGSGPLTYTYEWSRTDGVTTTPLTDKGLTHTITTADLGDYLSVTITATSPTQFATVRVKSPGVVVPKPPAQSDAGLTSANKGSITARTSKGVATITDPSGTTGDGVFVYGYSVPTELGWFALGANKTFTVNFLGLVAGDHKLAVQDQSGKMLGWIAVDRPATSGSTSGVNALFAGIGVVLILAIILLIVVTQLLRRRRERAAESQR